MKLLYIVRSYPPDWEYFIIREIAGLTQAGHTVDIATVRSGGRFSRSILPGILRFVKDPITACSVLKTTRDICGGVTEAFVRSLPGVFSSLHWADGVQRSGYNLIVGQFLHVPAVVSCALSRLSGIPYCVSAHAWDIAGSGLRIERILKSGVGVSVCSDYFYSRLVRQVPEQLHPMVVRLYHGLPVPDAFSEPEQANNHQIMSAGRFVPKKGYPYLIEAAAILRSRGRDVSLVMAGEGKLRQQLHRYAAQMLPGCVAFPGRMSSDEVQSGLKKSALLAVPSVPASGGDREGIPNILLEAAARGVPIVASRTGGIPDFIEHEQTGLLVPPADPLKLAKAMERVLSDQDLRSRLIRNAYARVVQRHKLERCVCRLEDWYQSIHKTV
mgnify:CR=1 FL=1